MLLPDICMALSCPFSRCLLTLPLTCCVKSILYVYDQLSGCLANHMTKPQEGDCVVLPSSLSTSLQCWEQEGIEQMVKCGNSLFCPDLLPNSGEMNYHPVMVAQVPATPGHLARYQESEPPFPPRHTALPQQRRRVAGRGRQWPMTVWSRQSEEG